MSNFKSFSLVTLFLCGMAYSQSALGNQRSLGQPILMSNYVYDKIPAMEHKLEDMNTMINSSENIDNLSRQYYEIVSMEPMPGSDLRYLKQIKNCMGSYDCLQKDLRLINKKINNLSKISKKITLLSGAIHERDAMQDRLSILQQNRANFLHKVTYNAKKPQEEIKALDQDMVDILEQLKKLLEQ